ncbi:hypothetical protein [Bradyrhizobium elkanii]
MTSVNLSAAAAAKQILGFYDTIPAMDPKAFAAGLVEILSSYPRPVIERAVSPSIGLASVVQYPNLAKFKKHLDEWADEHWENMKRQERMNRKRLSEPPADPEMQARVSKGLTELVAQLKRGLGPSTAG